MNLDPLEEKIIYYLMLQSGPITIARLADLCNVSANSIRSRIPYLNKKIRSEDLSIVMKRSVGCELHKLSEDRNSSSEINDLRFTINRANYISRTDRVDFIIRRLLCTNGYLPIQSACDMLFYSYSELHRDIAEANQYLEKFRLKIATRRSKGLYIDGDEFHKRVCIAFQHKRFRYLNKDQQKNEPWFAAIFGNSLRVDTIQQIMTDILNDFPEYAYSHLNFPKIMNMFYIMKSRHSHAGEIRFPLELSAYIKSTEAYHLAECMLKEIAPRIDFIPEAEDIVCLTIILECYRSVRTVDDLKHSLGFRRFREEGRSVIDEMTSFFFGTSVKASEESADNLLCTLYTAWTLTMYDLPLDEETVFPLGRNDASSADMAVALYHILRERYDIVLNPSLLKYLTFTLRTMQKDFSSPVNDCSLLVYSIYGAEYARYIALNLKRTYGSEFSKIDFIESMPALHDGISGKYDLLLTDNSSSNMKNAGPGLQDLPVIWLPLSNYPQRYEQLDEWLFQRNNEILTKLSENRIHHGTCRSKADVYHRLYSFISDQLAMTEEDFVSRCEHREAVFPSERDNRIAYIAMDPWCDEDLIAVLINKKPVPWYGDTRIQFFVFYNYSGSDYRSTRAIMQFLRMFVRQTPANLLSLVEKESRSIVSFIMKNDAKPLL